MEAAIWQTLITQTPGTAAVIIVVVLFLRAIKERDALFVEQMKTITEELKQIKALFIEHDTETKAGMDEMRRVAAKKRQSKTYKAE